MLMHPFYGSDMWIIYVTPKKLVEWHTYAPRSCGPSLEHPENFSASSIKAVNGSDRNCRYNTGFIANLCYILYKYA
jgi:hypothetical protein